MAEQNPVVLVCDDEVGIVTAIGGFLRAKGCTVLTAGNAVEAIAIGTEQASRLQLVVMDVMMPDALKVLYLSGHAQDENMYSGPAKLPMAMLHKPCSLTVLWKVVQDLLAFRDVVGEGR